VDRFDAECRGLLAELDDVDEFASARRPYLCSECQIAFVARRRTS
jgi:hypothetical protein